MKKEQEDQIGPDAISCGQVKIKIPGGADVAPGKISPRSSRDQPRSQHQSYRENQGRAGVGDRLTALPGPQIASTFGGLLFELLQRLAGIFLRTPQLLQGLFAGRG